MSIHPELVHLDRGEAGYTGDLEQAIATLFASGIEAVAANGVVGDPVRASSDHGARYWEKVADITMSTVGQP
jgi:creatinine amidohydrolase/Fe(II)-dependent formamide hydrolase-like protein